MSIYDQSILSQDPFCRTKGYYLSHYENNSSRVCIMIGMIVGMIEGIWNFNPNIDELTVWG